MIQDFLQSPKGTEFQTDICIIGAGAAGITLARALRGTGRDILLLESGGVDYEAETQDLATGQNTGFEYYPLRESRLRFFGGTTAIWGGRCSQLDAIDFETRDWVPHSGWPIGKDVLRPYYEQAQQLLGLDPVADNALPGFENPFDAKVLETAFWQFDAAFDRFTLAQCHDLQTAKDVNILLHATATQIVQGGDTIDSVVIQNLEGGHGVVRAKTYILATGGLEIPRLLLASGIGGDAVGRYFQEHPHARGGRVFPLYPQKLFRMLPAFCRYKGGRYGLLLRPGEGTQRDKKILNSGFTLAVRRHPGLSQALYKSLYNGLRHDLSPNKLGRVLWKTVKIATRWVEERLGPQILSRGLRTKHKGLYVIMRAEQAPNPDSRVTLSNEVDALGLPKIRLDWQLSEIDKRSVIESILALDAELRRLHLGTAEIAAWLDNPEALWDIDPLIGSHHIGGYHHIGTARMGDDPKDSVTDKDCRVHGIDNLYLAGSAVFPTSGWANPTLTILAMALRLAGHLKESYSHSP